MMISQGSSEANISLIVDESHIDAAVNALAALVKDGVVREVTHNKDVCAVAVVGAGMAGAAGTGGRIFTALGLAGVNVMMISQGSSEANISFVVRQEDGPRAVRVYARRVPALGGMQLTENEYRNAGVDIDLEATAIKALIKNLSFHRNGQLYDARERRAFSGLIDFGPKALALTTDGVGTKMLVADSCRTGARSGSTASR